MHGKKILNKFKIVFEDEWLIAVDKAPGVLVIETPKAEKWTLTRLLNGYLDSKNIEVNAYPCHRIDRETSGLILYAKGRSIQKKMMEAFKLRQVKKLYIALVHGTLKRPAGTIESYLYNRNKHKTELAISKFKVMERGHGFSVVEVETITGRTNQIRRQFCEIGHPLLGERVYAFAKGFPIKFRRVSLHAKSLEFVHPVMKSSIKLSVDMPDDIRNFLASNLQEKKFCLN